LREPRSGRTDVLLPRLDTLPPRVLPLEKGAGCQLIATQLEDAFSAVLTFSVLLVERWVVVSRQCGKLLEQGGLSSDEEWEEGTECRGGLRGKHDIGQGREARVPDDMHWMIRRSIREGMSQRARRKEPEGRKIGKRGLLKVSRSPREKRLDSCIR
jgi:hypothetical protein